MVQWSSFGLWPLIDLTAGDSMAGAICAKAGTWSSWGRAESCAAIMAWGGRELGSPSAEGVGGGQCHPQCSKEPPACLWETYLCSPDFRMISHWTFWGAGCGEDETELSDVHTGCNGSLMAGLEVQMVGCLLQLREMPPWSWSVCGSCSAVFLFLFFCFAVFNPISK